MTCSTGAEKSPAASDEIVGEPLFVGLIGAGSRLILGGGLALLCLVYPESHFLALADLPTLGTYALFSVLRVQLSITGAFDVRFLVLGSLTWFVVGSFIAALIHRLRSRRGS